MIRPAIVFAVLVAAGLSLGACGALNSSLSETMADSIPHWAGGLPADAPPRADDPKYADYIKKLNEKAVTDDKAVAKL